MFELGKTYQMTCHTNSDLKVTYKCIKRTNKMVILENEYDGQITRKINIGFDGVEVVYNPFISSKNNL